MISPRNHLLLPSMAPQTGLRFARPGHPWPGVHRGSAAVPRYARPGTPLTLFPETASTGANSQ
jgi:hypothetical protein